MDAWSDPKPIASKAEYIVALREACVSESCRTMLRIHYRAPDHTISAAQLAKALEYDNYSTINLHYGALGHRVSEVLGKRPGPFPDGNPHWWNTLSIWNDKRDIGEGLEQWIMRTEVREALEDLGWV